MENNIDFSILPFYENPQSDDQKLFNYQFEYKNGNAQALALMYNKLYEVAYKKINGYANKNENIKNLSADERQQKAHDAATYLIEQFLKRPDFYIKDSVTGYLHCRVSWELYGRGHQNKRDQMLVFTDKLPETNKQKKRFIYLVKDTITGETCSYGSAAELYLNPVFKGLRKKRLAESIRTCRPWKNYNFDLLELDE